MSKNNKEIKDKIIEHKYPILSFIEDNVGVRKKTGGGFAFQTWYKLQQNGTLHDKKTMKEWEKLFNKFLNQPVK